MFRTALFRTALAVVLMVAAGSAAYAQFPAQPPAVKLPMSSGDEKERAACHPDVTKYCKKELDLNPDDAFSILGCLQRNRPTISVACNNVLKSHGQ
jgi:hypothetical protein